MGIGAIAGIGSSLIGASSASKAAKSQERAAAEQIRVQEETRDQIRADLSGYREGGDLGRQALLYELGLGPKPMIGGTGPLEIETVAGTPGFYGPADGKDQGLNGQYTPGEPGGFRVGGQFFPTMQEAQAFASQGVTEGTPYQGFQATPGYQFQFDQGVAGVNALAGARGGLNSGRTMQDLTKLGQGIANQEYGTHMNRLGGLADTGLNAAAMQGTASSNAAAGISNALANRGNAQAAGAIGVGNAINTGIGNTLGLLNYQNSQPGGKANVLSTPWAAGGFWG